MTSITSSPSSQPKTFDKTKSGAAVSLPSRAKVKAGDTWDLSALFPSDEAWEKAFAEWEKLIPQYEQFKGKLGKDPATLLKCLQFDASMDRRAERIGVYAFLKCTEDQGDSTYQRLSGRYRAAGSKAQQAASYIRPEILAIPAAAMKKLLASPKLKDWKIVLERIVRQRPHTLGKKEEQLLAMQGPMADASNLAFTQLNNADLKWPSIRDETGKLVELSTSSFSKFLNSPKREVRANAFTVFYGQYDAHKNTIAAMLNGSVQRDVFNAKARNFATAREAALFPDNVPVSVYDNLISTVRANLPAVHRYYDLRRRAMKLKDIHHYDTYVPILSDIKKHHTWEQATKVIIDALQPLGDDYCRTLHEGLTSARWCDRYPNQGKQSGAFSSGTFDGLPYILMNYQPTVLDHVFTLAHEAGHSMHSFYSAKHQPFHLYDYTIFVAEVASTFNEQLLLEHMLKKATDKKERAYLINHAIDEIRGTVVRQTMFAEFEKFTHEQVEKGEPLTVETLRKGYRALLDAYFGPKFAIDPVLELECLRIPHFYRAFYVYKYATGLSASIALSRRVLSGGKPELDAYLGFLSGGCSKDPLDLLRGAGVDMAEPAPVEAAMKRFGELVDELDELL
jgi:oligoendopeptidase F